MNIQHPDHTDGHGPIAAPDLPATDPAAGQVPVMAPADEAELDQLQKNLCTAEVAFILWLGRKVLAAKRPRYKGNGDKSKALRTKTGYSRTSLYRFADIAEVYGDKAERLARIKWINMHILSTLAAVPNDVIRRMVENYLAQSKKPMSARSVEALIARFTGARGGAESTDTAGEGQ
jgi:hypothetical protein